MRDSTVLENERGAPVSGDEILAIHRGVELDTPQWLPDGSGIVFRSSIAGDSDFWIVGSDGSRMHRLTVSSRGHTSRLSPDGAWLAYLSNRAGYSEIWLHDMAVNGGADDRPLTSLQADINSFGWAPDSTSVAFSSNRYGSYDLYEIDVLSGTWNRLTSTRDSYDHYPTYLPDGERIAFVRLSDSWEDHDVMVLTRASGDVQTLARDQDFFDYQMGRRFGHPLVSPDGKRVLFRSHRSNWINYWYVDFDATESPAGPISPTRLLEDDFDHACESGSISCGEAAWSPNGRLVALTTNRDGNVQLRVVPRDGGSSSVIAAEGQGVASHPAWSPDGGQVAFLMQSFDAPPDVWIAELGEDGTAATPSALRQLTFSMPAGLGRKLTATPEKVRYTSFDGLEISAYVYRSESGPTNPGPVIIEIHGGPWDQFRDTMHLPVQYYLQRGYTVVMPNIRGSAGYGKRFQEGIKTGWGVDDLKDLEALARYLIDRGIAHKDRIAVTGQSYGGFMSMVAAVFSTPGTYQAAVSRVGYADWAFYAQCGGQRTVKLLRHMLGDPSINAELYDAACPLKWAERASVPILVVDQDAAPGDLRPDQREAFTARLHRYNKPVWYRRYANTGGPYAKSDAGAKQMLPDMIDFLDGYLK